MARLIILGATGIPRLVVPYADAAALMLANVGSNNAMSRHRVGLALGKAWVDESSRRRVFIHVTKSYLDHVADCPERVL